MLIGVVLGSETSDIRFKEMARMLDYGFANFAVVTPQLTEDTTVPVKLGVTSAVTAVLSTQEPLLVNKGQKSQISTQVELDPEVTAPVSKGQRLGTLSVFAADQLLKQIPLVAEEAVEKVTWGQMFIRLLRLAVMG